MEKPCCTELGLTQRCLSWGPMSQALSWIVVSTGFTAPTHAIYQQKLPHLGSLVDLSQCLACLMVDPESLTALEGDQPKPRLARDFLCRLSKEAAIGKGLSYWHEFAAWRKLTPRLSTESQAFLGLIQGYFATLQQLGLVPNEVSQLLERVQSIPGVLAAKGCGGRAADTLMVWCTAPQKQSIIRQLNQLGLDLIATEATVAPGVYYD